MCPGGNDHRESGAYVFVISVSSLGILDPSGKRRAQQGYQTGKIGVLSEQILLESEEMPVSRARFVGRMRPKSALTPA